MFKRGISDLVTAILIILLVLGAVAIVWAVVRPTVSESAGQITTECVTLSLEITGVNTTSEKVSVKRGAGAADLTKIKVVVDGDALEAEDASTLSELAEDDFDATGASSGSVVEVAGVVEGANGQEVLCGVADTYTVA